MRFLCLALTVLSALAVAQSPASSPAFLPASKATSAASAVVSTSGAAITPAIDPLARATTSTRGPFPTTSYPPQPPQPPGPPPLPQSSLWSYPQPPLPGRTASAPAAAFTVAESSPPALGPRVRKYNFNLGYSVGSPSGFRRRMATINNQFPGPVIEGWQGDTIEVTVVNNLDYPQGFHWHGIVQKDTPFMDGVPGISQCPIQPGKSFTYRFKLVGESGTYWYHSHYGNTMADGLHGAFIVHSKNDPLKKSALFSKGDYDDDRIMITGDWYHDESEFIVRRMLEWGVGYRGANIPRVRRHVQASADVLMPDAIIMNGVGQEDCNLAQLDVDCRLTTPGETRVRMGSKLRIRLINPSSLAQIRFSVDNHMLKVVEIDDVPIQPLFLSEIDVAPGQRVSVIVHLNQGGWFKYPAFWMRSRIAAGCILGGYKLEGLHILRYTDLFGIAWSGSKLPTTAPWPTLKDPLTAKCFDIDMENEVVPLVPENPPANTFGVWRFDSSFGTFINHEGKQYTGFGFNPYAPGNAGTGQVAFTNYINNPLLRQIEDGLQLNSSAVAAITLDQIGAADLIINNRDVGLFHPFHLHGRKFYIVARGTGFMTPEGLAAAGPKSNNPVRRDTFNMPSNSWAAIRIVTDTPGVWPIHCHIGWHLSEGKMAIVVVRPDEVRKFQRPADWAGLCNGLNVNEVGPARRTLPPQARHKVDKRQINATATATAAAAPTPKPTFDSPNGKNVPYFSMDRTSFTLIDHGYTITSSITISQTNKPAFALPTSVDSAAAQAAYATQTNRPAADVWSGIAPVADTVKATEGVPLTLGSAK